MVRGEKGGRGAVAPLTKRSTQSAVLIVGYFERALKGRSCRIIDRPDQAGDVARRGQLAAALRDTAPWRALEVDDEDVVLEDHQLRQIEVAMAADAGDVGLARQQRFQEIRQRRL